MPEQYIRLKRVQTNNLEAIDVSFPLRKITVITGKSGSGKSSLALDSLYAEGYLRYVESISPYVRQFLETIRRPDLDGAENLPPALAFRQKSRSRNARSIVASVSGLTDFLRLLYLNVSDFHCPGCGGLLRRYSNEKMVAEIIAGGPGRAAICFPYLGDRAYLLARGFYFAWRNGRKEELGGEVSTSRQEIFVDELEATPQNRERILEALATSGNLFAPPAVIVYQNGRRQSFSWNYYCEKCDREFDPPTESLFSFNRVAGACPVCNGYGQSDSLSAELLFDPELSIRRGAVRPLQGKNLGQARSYFFDKWEENGIDLDKRFADLRAEDLRILMEGADGFEGLRDLFDYMKKKSYKPANRFFARRFSQYRSCPECKGKRFNSRALSFRIEGVDIASFLEFSVKQALDFVEQISRNDYSGKISSQVLEELKLRLRYLRDCNLGYLNLSRLSHSLSRGEWQRLNLTFILGSTLSGTLLVLEQPSADLHLSELEVVKGYLKNLKNNGNTVVVVDNNPEIVKVADCVIEMGPGAGKYGGRIVSRLDAPAILPRPGGNPVRVRVGAVSEESALWDFDEFSTRNLRRFRLAIPSRGMTAVVGPGGCGKSSLLLELQEKFRRRFGSDKVELLDFSQQVSASRATLGSYFELSPLICRFFSRLPESRRAGFGPNSFSRNSAAGMCPACRGSGSRTLEMQFLSPLEIVCEECSGSGLRRETMRIRYRDLTIYDTLRLSLDELGEFLATAVDFSKTALPLLVGFGLGHLEAGRDLKRISWGELQRIKILKSFLKKPQAELWLLDEPLFGWHRDDIGVCLKMLEMIASAGRALVVVEHNPEIIMAAGYVAELGRGGGEMGGELIFAGTSRDWQQIAPFTYKKIENYLTNR